MRDASGDGAGPRRVGMHEVARLANVAASSVSRVLSGHPDVSPAMRARVMRAVSELGYEPDFLAQSLRRGATLSVGFVVGDISNPLLASIALGAEEVLRDAGYSMLLTNSQSNPDLDLAHIRLFLHRRVDGLILSLASERKKAVLDLLAAARVPVVVVDRQLPARAQVSAVLSDHRAGLLAATNHLLDLGHRRLGLVSGPMDILPSRIRLAAIKEALAARGLSPDALRDEAGPFSDRHGRAATHVLLDGSPPPTALIAGGNQLLSGCLEALRERNLEPGADIALVTCDDVPLAQLYRPPIAAVTRDTVELGRTAARLLVRRLQGATPEAWPLVKPRDDRETIVLPTTFVPRASLGPALTSPTARASPGRQASPGQW